MKLFPWLGFLLFLHTAIAADLVDGTFRPHARPILGGPDGAVLAMARGPGDTLVIAGDFLRVGAVCVPAWRDSGSTDGSIPPSSPAAVPRA